MVLNDEKNQDRRAKDESAHIARGKFGRTIELVIADSGTTKNEDFEGNGKLIGLLVEVPDLGGVVTLTVDIFPEDATNDEARIFTKSGLAKSTVHFVDVRETTSNNVPKYLFGYHNMKVTASAAIGAGAETVRVVPILGRH